MTEPGDHRRFKPQTAQRHGPRCEEIREFVRVARTTMDRGVKTKWRCPDCSFGLVDIDPNHEDEANA